MDVLHFLERAKDEMLWLVPIWQRLLGLSERLD